MILEPFQEMLHSIRSIDPDINIAAVQSRILTEKYKQGELSNSELTALLQNIQCQAAIDQQAAELESMELLNTAINNIIVTVNQ